MRTTVDLPDDLHRQTVAIARDTSRSLSATITDLVRRGLGEQPAGEIARSTRTGLPVVSIGRPVTSDDVRRLEDELA
jgi:predicted transcriptional regulator